MVERRRKVPLVETLTKILYLALLASSISVGDGETNVFIVHESDNEVGKWAVQAALDSLTEESADIIGKTTTISMDEDLGYSNMATVCTELDRMMQEGDPPDLVIDLTEAGITSEVMKLVSLRLGLPTVTSAFGDRGVIGWWRDLSEVQKKYLIQIRPPADLFPQIIRPLAVEAKLVNVAVLYDETFRHIHEQYKSVLRGLPIRQTFRMLGADFNASASASDKAELMELEEEGFSNFFVFGSMETLKNVLWAIPETGMQSKDKYFWFLATLDYGEQMDLSCCPNTEVMFLHPNSPSGWMSREGTENLEGGFYFDLTLKSVLAVNELKTQNAAPAISYNNCSAGLHEIITRDVDLRTALKSVSRPVAWERMDISFNGLSIMQFKVKLDLVKNGMASQSLGTWRAATSYTSLTDANLEPAIKHRGPRNVLRVATVVHQPFVGKNNVTGAWEGYCIDMLNDLKDKFGFEYELYEPEEKVVGYFNEETEQWTGVMGELHNRRADFAIGTIKPEVVREPIADFTIPYYEKVGFSILMKAPKQIVSMFKFANVMTIEVWISLLGAYLFMSMLVWVSDRWSPWSGQNNLEYYEEQGEERRVFTCRESFWYVLTAVTPQGGGECPIGAGGRALGGTWWVFCFVCLASYVANLAAFLTISRLEANMETLGDLGNQFNIKFTTLPNSETEQWLRKAHTIEKRLYEHWKAMSLDDSLSPAEMQAIEVYDYPTTDFYTKILGRIEKDYTRVNSPEVIEDAIEMIRTSHSNTRGFSLLDDETTIRFLDVSDCDLQWIHDVWGAQPYVLATPKGSSLLDMLNQGIAELLTERKLDTYKYNWWWDNPYEPYCFVVDDKFSGISIHNFGGAFFLPVLGVICSVCTLIGEYYYYKGKPKPSDSGIGSVMSNKEVSKSETRDVKKAALSDTENQPETKVAPTPAW